MDRSLRELAERTVGTHDFIVGLAREPKVNLARPDHATGISEAESEAESPADGCASLYEAIRDMSSYGSEVEAERCRGGDDGIPRRR
ncbi:hypothetical protein [Streptomyces sp. NBC_00286]|uniref:hypothetical protein n=1 Tax=Streptomyces sp. NBC_00286 TaxID=2975701 RepID=UPI002E2BC1B9|nr:hypothetical protein [Streptomyces sp. NBC_00286]